VFDLLIAESKNFNRARFLDHLELVCMAELFSVSSASLPGRTAIAMARQNWQNRIG
jgi:hypothetical protein